MRRRTPGLDYWNSRNCITDHRPHPNEKTVEPCALCGEVTDEVDIRDYDSGWTFTVPICGDCLVSSEDDAWRLANFIQAKIDHVMHYN